MMALGSREKRTAVPQTAAPAERAAAPQERVEDIICKVSIIGGENAVTRVTEETKNRGVLVHKFSLAYLSDVGHLVSRRDTCVSMPGGKCNVSLMVHSNVLLSSKQREKWSAALTGSKYAVVVVDQAAADVAADAAKWAGDMRKTCPGTPVIFLLAYESALDSVKLDALKACEAAKGCKVFSVRLSGKDDGVLKHVFTQVTVDLAKSECPGLLNPAVPVEKQPEKSAEVASTDAEIVKGVRRTSFSRWFSRGKAET